MLCRRAQLSPLLFLLVPEGESNLASSLLAPSRGRASPAAPAVLPRKLGTLRLQARLPLRLRRLPAGALSASRALARTTPRREAPPRGMSRGAFPRVG